MKITLLMSISMSFTHMWSYTQIAKQFDLDSSKVKITRTEHWGLQVRSDGLTYMSSTGMCRGKDPSVRADPCLKPRSQLTVTHVVDRSGGRT